MVKRLQYSYCGRKYNLSFLLFLAHASLVQWLPRIKKGCSEFTLHHAIQNIIILLHHTFSPQEKESMRPKCHASYISHSTPLKYPPKNFAPCKLSGTIFLALPPVNVNGQYQTIHEPIHHLSPPFNSPPLKVLFFY